MFARLTPFLTFYADPEWGGRNWNGGEVIEVVLRGRDGRVSLSTTCNQKLTSYQFLPLPWLIHVCAHELAHVSCLYLS